MVEEGDRIRQWGDVIAVVVADNETHAREAAAKKAKRTNKKATDEDKAVEQNVPLEVANNSQQEQLDLVS